MSPVPQEWPAPYTDKNLGWILGLGAVMFVEKAVAWGRWITAPVAALLAAWGLGLRLGLPFVSSGL